MMRWRQVQEHGVKASMTRRGRGCAVGVVGVVGGTVFVSVIAFVKKRGFVKPRFELLKIVRESGHHRHVGRD